MEDADLALLLVARNGSAEEADAIFSALRLKVPALVVLNKIDTVPEERIKQVSDFFNAKPYCKKTVAVSALKKINTDILLNNILELLPEGEPFYGADDLTDMPTRFFVGEMIREKIFALFHEEILTYHGDIKEFKEKADQNNGGDHCSPGITESYYFGGQGKNDPSDRHNRQAGNRKFSE